MGRRDFTSGDTVIFKYKSEKKKGVITTIEEFLDTDRRFFYAEILSGGDSYYVSINEISKYTTECEEHGDKLYSDKEKEWLCPFCEL